MQGVGLNYAHLYSDELQQWQLLILLPKDMSTTPLLHEGEVSCLLWVPISCMTLSQQCSLFVHRYWSINSPNCGCPNAALYWPSYGGCHLLLRGPKHVPGRKNVLSYFTSLFAKHKSVLPPRSAYWGMSFPSIRWQRVLLKLAKKSVLRFD